MAQKFNVVREERDTGSNVVHNKPVGTVFIDEDGRTGTLYLNHLTHKFKLVLEGTVTRRKDNHP